MPQQNSLIKLPSVDTKMIFFSIAQIRIFEFTSLSQSGSTPLGCNAIHHLYTTGQKGSYPSLPILKPP